MGGGDDGCPVSIGEDPEATVVGHAAVGSPPKSAAAGCVNGLHRIAIASIKAKRVMTAKVIAARSSLDLKGIDLKSMVETALQVAQRTDR